MKVIKRNGKTEDYRTFLNLTKQERVVPTVAHNALEDAKAQATTVMNYLNKGRVE